MASFYNHEKERPMKDVPRHMLWDLIPEGEVAKRVLLFPAQYCKDLILGLNLGKIDKDTEYVFFEREHKTAQIILSTCKKLGLKDVTIIENDFGKTHSHIRDTKSELRDILNKKFDLVFLDTCGGMSQQIEDMVRELWHKDVIDNETTKFAVTFSTIYRNNVYYNMDQQYRKSFKHPVGAMQLCGIDLHTSNWSCDKFLDALGIDSRYLVHFFHYKDGINGSPMIFFSIDTNKDCVLNVSHKETNGSEQTRRIVKIIMEFNDLDFQYSDNSRKRSMKSIYNQIKNHSQTFLDLGKVYRAESSPAQKKIIKQEMSNSEPWKKLAEIILTSVNNNPSISASKRAWAKRYIKQIQEM